MYLIDLQRQLMFIYSKVLFETLSQCIGKDRIGETIHNIRKPVSRVLGNTLALNYIELKSKQKFKNPFQVEFTQTSIYLCKNHCKRKESSIIANTGGDALLFAGNIGFIKQAPEAGGCAGGDDRYIMLI